MQRSTKPQPEPWMNLENGEIPGPDSSDQIDRWDRLVYKTLFGFRPLELSLYRPAGMEGPLPCIVWIHGGAFAIGSRSLLPSYLENADFFEEVAKRGYVVASIDYRLSGEAIWPAQIDDVHNAILWLQKNSAELGLDPHLLFTWGESAGAHLASMAALREPYFGYVSEYSPVVGAIAWYGPTDFALMDIQAGDNSAMNHDEPLSPESRLVGGPVQESDAMVRDANPANFVTPAAPPFLVRHGNNDRLVPHGQSEVLVNALKRNGISVDFEIFEGVGHGFEGLADPEQQIIQALNFIDSVKQNLENQATLRVERVSNEHS